VTRTLGIDLASADARTGVALVDWTADGGRLLRLDQPASDDLIVELAAGCDVIAIDAPLGWPVAFTDALIAHRAGQPWPALDPSELRLRRTDRLLGARGVWPLSVSTDRIGIVAFRAAQLLPRLGTGSAPARDGSDGVIEVYPAAALMIWQQRHRQYKRDATDHAEGRKAIAEWLCATFRVQVGEEFARIVASSDLLDALICAVLAHEWLAGRTEAISESERSVALEEGWIHVPPPTTGRS
jgi:predicted nuclease with RNAse H fold